MEKEIYEVSVDMKIPVSDERSVMNNNNKRNYSSKVANILDGAFTFAPVS